MIVETYRPITYEQPKMEQEHLSNNYVFRVDYASDTAEAVLCHDIESYLQEYRLRVKKSQYELLYTKDDKGDLALRSSDNGESMIEIGRRAVQDRLHNYKSVEKETADLLGMQRIEQQMEEAKPGDTILWASPPDPEVGYDYGFLYVGNVVDQGLDRKKLNVTAMRLDRNPSIAKFNESLKLLVNKEISYIHPNEFIANPFHLDQTISEQKLSFILKRVFAFNLKDDEAQKTEQALEYIKPLQEQFNQLVRGEASLGERRKVLFAMENAVEWFKSNRNNIIFSTPRSVDNMIDQFGFIPPAVVGSCDVVSKSPNTFGYGSIFSNTESYGGSLSSDRYGSLEFDCPSCFKKNQRPYNELVTQCQHCGSESVAC